MAKAFLICGSTGAGKSTLARKLVQEQKAQVFAIDEWMQNLSWKDAPPTDTFPWAIERVHRCENLIWILSERLLKSGINVVSDLGFSFREQRERFYQLLEKGNFDFQLHFIDLPASVRWERVQERNRGQSETFQFEVTDQMFQWMESQFEAPLEEEIQRAHGVIHKQ